MGRPKKTEAPKPQEQVATLQQVVMELQQYGVVVDPTETSYPDLVKQLKELQKKESEEMTQPEEKEPPKEKVRVGVVKYNLLHSGTYFGEGEVVTTSHRFFEELRDLGHLRLTK